MPILIKPIDPIPSSAANHLLEELRGYRDRRRDNPIQGRSFLIAGHRGAGKTMMLSNALDSLKAEGLKPSPVDPRPPRRFLLVPIHGPSLFSGAPLDASAEEAKRTRTTAANADPVGQGKAKAQASPSKPPASAAATSGDQAPASQRSPDNPVLLAALEQIVLSLYRALVDEMTFRYRERALEKSKEWGQSDTELLERAAQLQLELDEYPGPERLRDFWQAGDFLENGVLFPSSIAGTLERDQGYRELVALSTACEAFRRVSGTFQNMKQQLIDAAEREHKSEQGGGTTGKDLLPPLISLATGGLVGVGTAASGGTALTGIGAGLITAVGSSAVFKFSATRSWKRSYTREYTFIPRTDVATLDRALPALVERVRAAGLVPIFAVDELDKVDDLPTRMGPLVGQLKKFVSEQSFFCFLTNRDYYEYLQEKSLNETYPIEHTYFSDRLFVVFRSDDFHRYLEDVLVVPDAPSSPPATASDRAAAAAPATGVPGQDDEERTIALKDRDVLPYILLHRAQMHATDVRRQVDEIRAPGDLVALAPGTVRSRLSDKLDLMVQLAMRIVLDRDELKNASEREPAFLRLAYDALYYPTRLRRCGKLELDLSESESAKSQFRDDMTERMASEKGKKRDSWLKLDQNDLDFLFARVREMADILADPLEFCEAMDKWEDAVGRRLSQPVRETLPLMPPGGPLLEGDHDGGYHYRWGYDHLGRDAHPQRRTALAYQIEVEYRLAVRMALAGHPAEQDAETRRPVRAAMWIPYRYWERGDEPVRIHALPSEGFKAELARMLPESTFELLTLTPASLGDLRDRIADLLEILSDAETFRNRLVTEGWTAAYPLLTQQLRPHSAILARRASTPAARRGSKRPR